MKKEIVKALIFLILLAVILWAGLRWLEKRMAFFPTRSWDFEASWIEGAREVAFFAADGVSLSAVWVPAKQSKGVILYCHGNAGNLSHRLPMAERWRDEFGWSVFLFDYRGYGKSQGKPSEKGILLDARAAFEEARKLGGSDPAVAGRSLGTVPAIRLAAEERVRGLILDSPLCSAAEMAREVLPIPGVERVLTLKLDNLKWIGRVRCPVLVLHGERDTIIPLRQGRRIFEAAPDPRQMLVLPRMGHNDDRNDPGILEFIRGFLDGLPN